MGVLIIFVENPEGRGVTAFLKKWKIWGGEGVLSELASMVGVWIFSGTTHYIFQYILTSNYAAQY